MNFLKKLGCAAAVAFAAGSVHAAPVMNNWTFDPDGSATVSEARVINEYLDVNGNGFIQLSPNGPGAFKFTEYGVFNIMQSDGWNKFGTNISVTLEAFGTGNFSGAFEFGGGVIKMYQNNDSVYGSKVGIYGADQGTLIGTFNVLAGGGGLVNANGSPLNNGQVSIFAESKVGMLKAGHFFTDTGIDMSTLDVNSFAFTNANTITQGAPNLVSELVCEFAGFQGAGCTGGTYANAPGKYLLVSNNGDFKFAEIPEPGSVALFGAALFGIGALRRRVK